MGILTVDVGSLLLVVIGVYIAYKLTKKTRPVVVFRSLNAIGLTIRQVEGRWGVYNGNELAKRLVVGRGDEVTWTVDPPETQAELYLPSVLFDEIQVEDIRRDVPTTLTVSQNAPGGRYIYAGIVNGTEFTVGGSPPEMEVPPV